MPTKNMMKFCDLQEMMKPIPIFLPKGAIGHRYIQEYIYDDNLGIYIKSKRIKPIGRRVTSREIENIRMNALDSFGTIR